MFPSYLQGFDNYYSAFTSNSLMLPKGANLLRLLGVYVLKDDGMRKACCVCNDAPNMAGSVTLAQTYAVAVDQTGAHLFLAKAALDNLIILGADASNAFAEAPAPVAMLTRSIQWSCSSIFRCI